LAADIAVYTSVVVVMSRKSKMSIVVVVVCARISLSVINYCSVPKKEQG
jgi:hypothetical protein